MNIRETSIHNSVVAIVPLCSCVFSVFLCLFYVCEHPSLNAYFSACVYPTSVDQSLAPIFSCDTAKRERQEVTRPCPCRHVCNERLAFEPRELLLVVGDLRERLIARNLSELTFEPNSCVSECVSSFVNSISLIK